eukprot:jgi/Chlat1/4591/Chrsp290S04334
MRGGGGGVGEGGGDDLVVRVAGVAGRIVSQCAPLVAHASVATAAFVSTLGVTQVTAGALRVSCATPVLGTAFGIAGVAAASVAAGQASHAFGEWRESKHWPQLRAYTFKLTVERMATDAMLGVAMFAVLGCKYSSILPSDLRFPGALARVSIPVQEAEGVTYADKLRRGVLRVLFEQYGCHLCGIRTGQVVADHMPPNLFVYGSKSEPKLVRSVRRGNKWFVQWRKPALQRYYPSCLKCSGMQSGAVKLNIQKLRFHTFGPQRRLVTIPGVLLAFRDIGSTRNGSGTSEHDRPADKRITTRVSDITNTMHLPTVRAVDRPLSGQYHALREQYDILQQLRASEVQLREELRRCDADDELARELSAELAVVVAEKGRVKANISQLRRQHSDVGQPTDQ